MPDLIRTFIAIELDAAPQRALADIQARLMRARGANAVRWVTPKNIHLTLKFLGAVEAARMPAIQQAVSDACAGSAPLTLKIVGIGAFPNTRRPNVVWVGVAGDIERAAVLAQRIEDHCAALGFARDARAFTPHLTLGRVKKDAHAGDARLVGEMIERAGMAESPEFRVERVSMMQSELKPGGSVYARLAEARLEEGR
ncbi:MAG: RNA 2',3'-cyclic phosphodiesterase [Chloroflexi bacterium]|nr:RNA 2',3'-cyclic phosphodiesterase [Chloroflexota bacterium]